jgi:hypothetical protein
VRRKCSRSLDRLSIPGGMNRMKRSHVLVLATAVALLATAVMLVGGGAAAAAAFARQPIKPGEGGPKPGAHSPGTACVFQVREWRGAPLLTMACIDKRPRLYPAGCQT